MLASALEPLFQILHGYAVYLHTPSFFFYSFHLIVSKIFICLILCHRRGHIINFCWVPAHMSVERNERSYEVAKAADLLPAFTCPLPCRELFPFCYSDRLARQVRGYIGNYKDWGDHGQVSMPLVKYLCVRARLRNGTHLSSYEACSSNT